MKSMLSTFIILAIICYLVFNYSSFQRQIVSTYVGFPHPLYHVQVEKDVKIPMPDGTELANDIFRPKAEGQYPVILMRTPYDKTSSQHRYALLGELFASQGYVFVVQDVRGKYRSEGAFVPYIHEAQDGKATVEWVVKAPWSNGRVGLMGFSYPGSCAWLAGEGQNPHVQALVVLFTSRDTYSFWIDKGVPYLKDMVIWLSKNQGNGSYSISHEKADRALEHLPANEIDTVLNGQEIRTFQEYLQHLYPDPYWTSRSPAELLPSVPTLMFAGWDDRLTDGMIRDFQNLHNQSPAKLIIGPWRHNPMQKGTRMDLPTNADFMNQLKTILDWFNEHLKGNSKEPVEHWVVYFETGSNQWKTSHVWPPEEMHETSFYLHSGKLSHEPLDRPQTLSYDYDPSDPTPSAGFRMLYGENQPSIHELSKRHDVLTFESAPLEQPISIAGQTKLQLIVSSSAEDTDFAATLLDVDPENHAEIIQKGFLRMRYRDFPQPPKTTNPGEIQTIMIDLGHTSHVFQKGHKLELLISSADFPYHSRNLNTTEVPEFGTQMKKATQNLFLGGSNGSQLILPVSGEHRESP